MMRFCRCPWMLFLLFGVLMVGCDIDDLVKNDTYAVPESFSESAYHIDGIVLDNQNGDVTITTHSRNVIDIFAEKYVTASSREDARDFVDDVEIEIRERSGTLNIECQYPRDTPRSVGEVGVDYEIRLPAHLNVEVSTVDGDVSVVGTDGDLDIAVTNGEITLDAVRGNIRARNVNGDIELRQAQGTVSADSTNGELFIELLDRNVQCDARTNNGDITIYIPQDASTRGNLRTANGRIRSDFVMEHPQGSGRFYVELGAGAGELEAWTNNGDIELRSLGRVDSGSQKRR